MVFHIYHNYEGESVGGGVDHKEEDNEGSDADEVEADNGGRGGSAGVVVARVLLPLILLAVTATIAVVVFLDWRRRYSSKQSVLPHV